MRTSGPTGKEPAAAAKQPMETTITPFLTTSDVPEPPSRGMDAVNRTLDPSGIVDAVRQVLEDGKAEEISVIDLAGKTSIADFMVVASGRSSRQVSALSDQLVRRLRELGIRPATEGKTNADWVIVDTGSVIVHVFRPEVRAFYNLEKMWGHAAAEGAARPFPMAGQFAPLSSDFGGMSLPN